MTRIVAALAELIVRGRAVVLTGTLLFFAVASYFSLGVRTEFSPDALLPASVSSAGPLSVPAEWAPEAPLLLVIEATGEPGADDVLSASVLGFIADASAFLVALPAVSAVDSLTATPLPAPAGGSADLTLDSLEAEGDALAIPVNEAVEGPLADLIRSSPRAFPNGLLSLADHLGGAELAVAPLAQSGADVDEDAVRRAVARLPSLSGTLLSRDRRWTVVVAHLPDRLDEGETRAVVAEVERWIAAHPAPPGCRVMLAGMPRLRVALVEPLERDRVNLFLLACVGSLLVLGIAFRRTAAVVLPFAVVGTAIVGVLGAMSVLGIAVNLVSNVIPPLLVSVGLSESVHMVVVHGDEVSRGADPVRAAVRMIERTWFPCFLTSATTAVGFASVAVSPTATVREFGVIAALAVAFAYVVTMTFIPAALATPVATDVRASRLAAPRSAAGFGELGVAIVRWRSPIVVGAAALTVVAAAVGFTVRIDAAILDSFDPDAEPVRVARILEHELRGVRVAEIAVSVPEGFPSAASVRDLGTLRAALLHEQSVLGVGSPFDVLGDAWTLLSGQTAAEPDAAGTPAWASGPAGDERARALAALVGPAGLGRFVSSDGRTVRLFVQFRDAGASELKSALARAEAKLAGGARPYRIWGEAYRSSVGLDGVVRGLLQSFALGAAIIFGMIFLAFRSLRFGAASVLSNVLPLAITLAYMALRGIPLHAATAMVFDVTIGVIVDGGIHVMNAFRHTTGATAEARARAAMAECGPGVLVGALTLLAGFGGLAASSFVPIRLFGELSAVALVSALVCQLVVLPAALSYAEGPRTRQP
jgi:predicted RND superfamily exporter protein